MGNSGQRNAKGRLTPLDLFEPSPNLCSVMLENRETNELMHNEHGRPH